MKNENGFSLIELLIVVAIIAIIAAIAVPSLLTSRMAANEASAIQGCRTVGSAEIAFAATSNQAFDTIANLVTAGFLDSRFTNGIDGYTYIEDDVTVDANTNSGTAFPATVQGAADFGVVATPSSTSMGRYSFGIGTDQIVRYQGETLPVNVTAGDGIGSMAAAAAE